MRFALLIAVACLFSCSETPSSQKPEPDKKEDLLSHDSLLDSIKTIVSGKKAEIGVAIVGPEGDTLSFNGDKPFPMMSVAKFPQALTLLHMVDEGKMRIDEPLHITEEDLRQRTFSTLTKDFPQKKFDLSIAQALSYSVGQSDNITSNVIFAREGGPQAVEEYVHNAGVKDVGVAVDYWHLTDETAASNWSTPRAMVLLLEKFYAKELLKEDTHAILWEAMTTGPSGPNRLRGMVPAGTVVAHKTGTGNRDEATGRIIALNDVGIILLPDGRHFSIAVFTASSYQTQEETEAIIAEIAKVAFNFYSASKK